ncbi:NUDIX domain-containing protein [Longispora sp. NPDC051575]|uniref:NUDIX domain-containing protein n=1 Tax=Longispora sp. NPDC051575 TaxID=3154943 RepID=UPI003432082A
MSWAESYHGRLRAFAGDEEVLIFVGARCLLRDDGGRILLIRRSDNGLWAVPAGGMELGDSVRQCAVREVWEETGLTPTELAPIAILSGADSTVTNQWGHTYQSHITVFLATAWTGELVTRTDETIDAGWFHPDQLPAPHATSVPALLRLLEHYDRTGEFVAP